jgi:hypothetical protein
MYNHDIKDDAGYYCEAQAIPQATTGEDVAGNGGVMQLSQTMGGIELKGIVTTAITLSDAKKIEVKLWESSDNADSDAYAVKETLYTKTADGTESVAANTELFNYVLPSDTERYTKVTLTSTDDDITGAVSVYGRYLPR